MAGPLSRRLHAALTSRGADREPVSEEQPRHFLVHVASLTATKTGDGLADPKLVLSWLFSQLGAGAGTIGLLVPIREAGSLLPQLAISGWVGRRRRRKWVWAGACVGQGAAVLGMGVATVTLEGAAAAWTILGLLAAFALARSFASVSYKDVLGRTVEKRTRGTATGAAGTASATLVLAYGAALATGVLPLTPSTIAGGLAVAGLLWLAAAAAFSTLDEEPDEDGAGSRVKLLDQLQLLRERPQLRRFIVTRALLVATALSPPFLVALTGSVGGDTLGTLGPFVVAAAVARLSSSYLWGRLADRSSRRTLQAAGAAGALALGVAGGLALLAPELAARTYAVAALLFVVSLAHQGVRLGRSTHLVDMAPEEDRAAYTALSNTAIGVVLVAGGGLGLAAERVGLGWTLTALATLCAAAALVAQGLHEVQRRD